MRPIHASVIFRFPEFAELSESRALFRKNSNHQPVHTFKTELTLSCVVQVTHAMHPLNDNGCGQKFCTSNTLTWFIIKIFGIFRLNFLLFTKAITTVKCAIIPTEAIDVEMMVTTFISYALCEETGVWFLVEFST